MCITKILVILFNSISQSSQSFTTSFIQGFCFGYFKACRIFTARIMHFSTKHLFFPRVSCYRAFEWKILLYHNFLNLLRFIAFNMQDVDLQNIPAHIGIAFCESIFQKKVVKCNFSLSAIT